MKKHNTRATLWAALYLHHLKHGGTYVKAADLATAAIKDLLAANPPPEVSPVSLAAHQEEVMEAALFALGTTAPIAFEPITATLDSDKPPAWAEFLLKRLDEHSLNLSVGESSDPLRRDDKAPDDVPPFVRDIARSLFGNGTEVEIVKVSRAPRAASPADASSAPKSTGLADGVEAPRKDGGKVVLQLIAYGEKRADVVLGDKVFASIAQGFGPDPVPAYARAFHDVVKAISFEDLFGAAIVAAPRDPR